MIARISLALIVIGIAGCKSEQASHGDGYSPAVQQCVTTTDPNCVGGATAGIQVPLPEARDKSLPKSESSIFGRCEMVVVGESKARPCNGVKLIVRATREGEARTAVIEGFNFKIEDLSERSYDLETVSPKYDISTDTKKLSPGQSVKIKVIARPRR